MAPPIIIVRLPFFLLLLRDSQYIIQSIILHNHISINIHMYQFLFNYISLSLSRCLFHSHTQTRLHSFISQFTFYVYFSPRLCTVHTCIYVFCVMHTYIQTYILTRINLNFVLNAVYVNKR